MYNECPADLKRYMDEKGIAYQLVPPSDHHTNPEERAICTFKNHLTVTLSGADLNTPIHLWYCLIPHVLLTFNLLRASNVNPKLSEQVQLNGSFDFNPTPLAPPEIKKLTYEIPPDRGI